MSASFAYSFGVAKKKKRKSRKPGLLTPSAREDPLPLNLGQERNEASPIEGSRPGLEFRVCS